MRIPRIRLQSRKFICKLCRTMWDGQVLCNVTIDVFCAHLNSLRCPNCGADSQAVCIDLKSEQEEIDRRALSALARYAFSDAPVVLSKT